MFIFSWHNTLLVIRDDDTYSWLSARRNRHLPPNRTPVCFRPTLVLINSKSWSTNDIPELKLFDVTFHECGINRDIPTDKFKNKQIIFNYNYRVLVLGPTGPSSVNLGPMSDVKRFCVINKIKTDLPRSVI